MFMEKSAPFRVEQEQVYRAYTTFSPTEATALQLAQGGETFAAAKIHGSLA